MPSVRSRSLLTIVAVAPWATSCFLSGDYSLKEQTVTVPDPETRDEATSSSDGLPSEATSTPPTAPPPAPTTTEALSESQLGESLTAPAVTSSEASLVADSSTPAVVSSSAEESEPITSDSNVTSSAPTSEPNTNDWQGSNWWDSSGNRCWQGNCNEGCGNDEMRGPRGRCYWFDAGQGTWEQAKATCSSRGTNWVPITIHDEQEDGFISSQVDREGETWIGAQYSMGAWRWLDDKSAFWNGTGVNGTPVAGVFNKWGTGEPSGSNSETCGRVESFNGDMRWGDSKCTEVKLFACQSPAPGSN